jgi:hypothetical protein
MSESTDCSFMQKDIIYLTKNLTYLTTYYMIFLRNIKVANFLCDST